MSSQTLASWLALLGQGGVISAGDEVLAGATLFEQARLDELSAWLQAQPIHVRIREQMGAIEACIHMAHADRELHEGERALLIEIIEAADLSDAMKAVLGAHLEVPVPIGELGLRVTHPVLRELLLHLCWSMAKADGRICEEEEQVFELLATTLGVSESVRDRVKSS